MAKVTTGKSNKTATPMITKGFPKVTLILVAKLGNKKVNMPPTNPPAHNAKKICKGSCVKIEVQRMNLGRYSAIACVNISVPVITPELKWFLKHSLKRHHDVRTAAHS